MQDLMKEILKFHMRPDPEGMDRSAVHVICGIKDKLVIGAQPEVLPEKAEVVIQFGNEFRGIIEVAIPDDKTITPGFQETAMV